MGTDLILSTLEFWFSHCLWRNVDESNQPVYVTKVLRGVFVPRTAG